MNLTAQIIPVSQPIRAGAETWVRRPFRSPDRLSEFGEEPIVRYPNNEQTILGLKAPNAT